MKKKAQQSLTVVLHRHGADGMPEPVLATSDQRIVQALVREIGRVTGGRVYADGLEVRGTRP